VTGSQIDAGSSKNTFDYTLNEGTLADNYEIKQVEGTLTVNAVIDKVTVTITEHSGSETYDGTEKTVTGYDVSISNPLYTENDFGFSGDATIKGTDAGSYPMGLKAADFANTSKNFTDVEFIIADGTLEIAKRQITVSVADAAADILYDGAEHSGESETTFTNVAEGQTASITYTPAKGTLVGSYTGTFEDDFKVTDAEGNDVTKNYELTEKTAGKLNITDEETPDQPIDPSKVITKEHEGGEFKLGETITWMITVTNIYNEAKAVTVTEAEGVTLGEYPDTLEAGETVTIAATHVVTEDDILNGGFTNKASVELGNIKKEAEDEATTEEIKAHMTVTKTVTNKPADGKTFKTGETIEYQITVKNDGNVTISGITVNDDKTGDSWQTASIAPGAEEVFTAKYTVTEADAAKGEVVNTATAEGTDPKGGAAEVEPGTHTETVERDSVNDIIDPKPGTGESMGADGKTITAKYDGKSHTVSASATKEGSKIEYSTDGGETWTEEAPALTNVGTVSYQIRATHPYYEDVVKTGYTLEITKRSVILTSPDASKRYDGQALTSTNIAVTGDGFVSGEGATYNVTGTITNVGTAQNTFTYTLNPNTLASNYDIRQVFGNLTITRRSSGGSETTPTPGPTPDPTPTPEEPTPTPTPTPEPEIPVAPAAPAAPAVAGAAVTPTVPDAGVLGARLNPPAEEAEAEAPEAEAEGEPEGDVAGEQIQPIQQIEEVEVPLAEGPAGSWALLNLILAAVTTLISGALLALYFKKKKEDEEEEKAKQAGESRKEDEEEEKEKKKGLIRTLSLIPAAASIITFILTEDMSTQMALTDSWTILMAVYCAANVVAAFASRKKTEDGKEEEANA
jgi:hypothetical protein